MTITATSRTYPTSHALPEASRVAAIAVLNQRLADCIDLQIQAKQAHWNVKGPAFIALHKLFDDVNAGVGGYADLLAERAAQLGGVAEGTIAVVAERTNLADYPLTLASGPEHLASLAGALASFAETVRAGIDALDALDDPAGADILTEILRGTDKWLWFVEAHLQDA